MEPGLHGGKADCRAGARKVQGEPVVPDSKSGVAGAEGHRTSSQGLLEVKSNIKINNSNIGEKEIMSPF